MTKSRGVADWGHYPPVNNNILINPNFTVTQRGAVINHDNYSYGPDRWAFRGRDLVGGTRLQSTTDYSSGINKMVVEHDGAASYASAYQHIETVNLLGLYGKELTFSFSYSDTGGSGVPYVSASSFNSSDIAKTLFNTVPTSLGNNRWTCTFTLSTSDGTLPGLSARGIQVAMHPNKQNTAPDKWSVWETKLEAGSAATPFIARSYGEERALCQRYYYTTGGFQIYYTAASYMLGGTSSTSVADIWYPVTMRTTPSLLPYTTSQLSAKSEVITSTRARLNANASDQDRCAKVESPLIFDAEL